MKLVKNFRSHPAILQFPNSEFYNGELQSCGNPALTHSLEHSDELVKKKFPLVFHGIIGKDQREESSPSFFNIDEATVVKNYCSSLITNRKNRIRSCLPEVLILMLITLVSGPEDIGVITPYHAQRCKILDLLNRDYRLKGITVGSVEEFQGQVQGTSFKMSVPLLSMPPIRFRNGVSSSCRLCVAARIMFVLTSSVPLVLWPMHSGSTVSLLN